MKLKRVYGRINDVKNDLSSERLIFMNVAYNKDCLTAMREFPDNYFDLACVDPPYGSALTSEAGGVNHGTGSAADSTGTKKVSRTGGTWAAKFEKKS